MSFVQALAGLVGAVIGFTASHALRRPSRTAAAASVGRNVSGALGRRKGLTLPELQRASLSEMVRHVRVGPRGQAEVPTRFVVRLHPADATTVEEAPRWFADGLADAMARAAAEHGWSVAGPVSITVEPDEARHQGAPAVLAVQPGGPPAAAPTPPPEEAAIVPARSGPVGARPSTTRPGPPAARPAVLRRLDSGERTVLGGAGATIGRASDCTVVLDDSRVSRHHAQVRPHGAGWVVTDEGSSNGTRVNGALINARRPTTLRTGDTLEIGPARFRLEPDQSEGVRSSRPTPDMDDDRTVALDEDARRRLSAELLTDARAPRERR